MNYSLRIKVRNEWRVKRWLYHHGTYPTHRAHSSTRCGTVQNPDPYEGIRKAWCLKYKAGGTAKFFSPMRAHSPRGARLFQVLKSKTPDWKQGPELFSSTSSMPASTIISNSPKPVCCSSIGKEWRWAWFREEGTFAEYLASELVTCEFSWNRPQPLGAKKATARNQTVNLCHTDDFFVFKLRRWTLKSTRKWKFLSTT